MVVTIDCGLFLIGHRAGCEIFLIGCQARWAVVLICHQDGGELSLDWFWASFDLSLDCGTGCY